MLAKGLDFVIGVDVGAPLYKIDEISSVLDILDQISSFHQQDRYNTNLRLTDLYIKPDINGLSAMSFDDVTDVIHRGEIAAMQHIDEIRRLASELKKQREYKKRVVHLNTSDTIYITNVEIRGLEKLTRKLIVSRLSINLPGVNTVEKINEAVDRLYASNFFEFINYKLIRGNNGYKLDISVKENNNSLFNIGASYDTDQGANLLINLQLLNKLIAGSRWDFSLKVGAVPAGGIRYIVDRGRDLGFGIDANYISNHVKFYNDANTSVQADYFISFTSLNLLLFSNYSNNAVFILKGTMDFAHITSEISVVPVSYRGDPFFNLSGEYILDSYDNKYFPTTGSFLKINPVLLTQYNSKGLFYANIEMATVVNVSNKISFLPSAFLGASWGDLSSTGYVYMLGGAGMNEFKNMKSFIGLPHTATLTNNLLMGRVDLRYQFIKNHYLYLKVNASIVSDLFEELFVHSDAIVLGAGVSYRLKSMIGPIELGMNMSSAAHTPVLFFNIGFFL